MTTEIRSSFSPNFIASTHLLSELNDFHKKRLSQHLKYMVFVFRVIGLIGLVLSLVAFALMKWSSWVSTCRKIKIVFLALSSTILGSSLLRVLIVGACGSCIVKRECNDFNDIEAREQLIIWRLEGDEWLRYLNDIHSPDRQWLELTPLS